MNLLPYSNISSGDCQQPAVSLLGAPPLPAVATAACHQGGLGPFSMYEVRVWLIDQALDVQIGIRLKFGPFADPEKKQASC